ncbi:helix-turn-helix domain-containing protein [Tenacibaculum xiamenense]|uniref:helix-turn-helix domain-containing protein n=1 Tax=Tenacibaculum xiamenense TaxID=1261553 RepID=UPI00389638E6
MKNENIYIMKQPDLGKKIFELRKQKGYTQEELVEKCNINVRTIQRIEAGETTPRSVTVKLILEALGVESDEITKADYKGGKFDKLFGFTSNNFKKVLNLAWIFGISYFIFGFAEVGAEANYYLEGENYFNDFSYILIKITTVVSFTFFMRGFVFVGSYYKNSLLEFMAFLMILLNLIFGISDVVSLFIDESYYYYFMAAKVITFGCVGVIFGIGIIGLRKHIGDLAIVAGVLEIIAGIFFATVILAIAGAFALIPLEIIEIVILYKIASKLK